MLARRAVTALPRFNNQPMATISRAASQATRSFTSTHALQQAAAPVKKPVGAFRGGLFGFLLGSTLAGAAVYYYILEEYRVSNDLLSEDIYSLQAAVQRIESYTRNLDEQVTQLQKKNK